jgi:hypothetical protein
MYSSSCNTFAALAAASKGFLGIATALVGARACTRHAAAADAATLVGTAVPFVPMLLLLVLLASTLPMPSMATAAALFAAAGVVVVVVVMLLMSFAVMTATSLGIPATAGHLLCWLLAGRRYSCCHSR